MAQKSSPYIDNHGTLIIPFGTDPKYHFWNGGQPLSDTLLELNAPEDVWNRHLHQLGGKAMSVPLCDFEVTSREDRNFWPVREYVVWFANRTLKHWMDFF